MTLSDGAHSAADENTPLLAASEAAPTTQTNEEVLRINASNGSTIPPKPTQDPESGPLLGSDDTPLPKTQIFLLCYCALVEPVAYFSIFPFVNQMIKETGDIEDENVGFWSGMIESLFSLTQMLLMIFYGRAADRLGRKPVLVFSLTGAAVSTALFGMSKSVWQMIAFRCLAGVFAGVVVTVRTMISENCTPKTQARAFSFFAFTRNLGIFLGPLIGGSLSNPATQYPRIFGSVKFFHDYPYALPTISTGTIAAIAAILISFFLKETLNRKDNPDSKARDQMSTWELMKAPGVSVVLYIYAHTMLLGLAFTAVIPVFSFTPMELGGYGFPPQTISLLLAVAGAAQALWILLAFPPLQRRFSTGAVLRGCAVAWPFFFLGFPVSNEFLRHHWMVPFWMLVAVNQMGGSGVSMAFTCVQLNLNDIAPSPSTLGTLNALALTLNSGLRSVAPALFSTIFATGVKLHFIDGHLVWIFLILLAIGLIVGVRWLPEKAEGRVGQN